MRHAYGWYEDIRYAHRISFVSLSIRACMPRCCRMRVCLCVCVRMVEVSEQPYAYRNKKKKKKKHKNERKTHKLSATHGAGSYAAMQKGLSSN